MARETADPAGATGPGGIRTAGPRRPAPRKRRALGPDDGMPASRSGPMARDGRVGAVAGRPGVSGIRPGSSTGRASAS